MSRTLFWYIFKDLLRIFLLASAALAGIMSFGGLLRPIYEHGLDATQVAKLLGYFMPAMTTYSLPIAALYATTMVYGRLSADNEVTAARAAGISHLSLALPAFVIGLSLALLSMLLLCFVVPVFWLRIERVLYSNLAQVVADQIQRTHQVRFEHSSTPLAVFAQEAQVLPDDPDRPDQQAVQLIAPMIVIYGSGSDRTAAQPPEEFYTARSATAVIRQSQEDDSDVLLYAALENGMRFPRRATASRRQNVQVSVRATNFGPIPLPSPVREETKFMDVFRLRRLLDRPELSRRVRSTLGEFIRSEQQQTFLESLQDQLEAFGGTIDFDAGTESYTLQRGTASSSIRKGRLVLVAPAEDQSIRLLQRQGRDVTLDVEAQEVRIRVFPDPVERRVTVELEMIDCLVADVGGERTPREDFTRQFSLPMSPALTALEQRTAREYLAATGTSAAAGSPDQQRRLLREVLKIRNGVTSELNARASFGVSCLILVMVGCALGMMFRSGNFLSAFALSVVPALLSIALIVTGQHTCENIPWNVTGGWGNPLKFGLLLIWSGNAAVAAIAVVLLWRLQRQ